MYASEDRQLGIAPAIVAAAIPTASKLVKGILGGTSKQRDKARFKEIDALYARAIDGDSAALSRLKSAGWATAPAKKYSVDRYQAAVSVLAGKGFSVSDGSSGAPVAQASVVGGIPAPVLLGGAALVAVLLLTRRK